MEGLRSEVRQKGQESVWAEFLRRMEGLRSVWQGEGTRLEARLYLYLLIAEALLIPRIRNSQNVSECQTLKPHLSHSTAEAFGYFNSELAGVLPFLSVHEFLEVFVMSAHIPCTGWRCCILWYDLPFWSGNEYWMAHPSPLKLVTYWGGRVA